MDDVEPIRLGPALGHGPEHVGREVAAVAGSPEGALDDRPQRRADRRKPRRLWLRIEPDDTGYRQGGEHWRAGHAVGDIAKLDRSQAIRPERADESERLADL